MRQVVPAAAAQRVKEATALAREGKLKEALVNADDAVSFEPKWEDGHATRGMILSLLNRHKDAAESFGAAIALRPDEARYHNGRGNAHLALRQFGEARTDYLEAVRLDPNDLAPYIPLAICHHALGDTELESQVLTRYAALGGTVPDNYDEVASTTQ